MISLIAAAMMLTGAPAALAPQVPMILAQARGVTIRMHLRETRSTRRVRWREEKGPECVPLNRLAGVTLLGSRSVDFLLKDDSRLRAELDGTCPALDFYYGFYLTATADGKLCAERDSLRSRIGSRCAIDRFHRLEPEPF